MAIHVPNENLIRNQPAWFLPRFEANLNRKIDSQARPHHWNENWIDNIEVANHIAQPILKNIERSSKAKSYLIHPVTIVAIGCLALIPTCLITTVFFKTVFFLVNTSCVSLLINEMRFKSLSHCSNAYFEESQQADALRVALSADPLAFLILD